MTMKLVPCAACARHIRESETSCPFCGAVAVRSATTESARPLGRLSRAALLAVGAAGALAATDCSSSSAVPLYGAAVPPDDSGVDGSTRAEGGTVDGGGFVQPVYGAMVPPEGVDDAGASDATVADDATVQPLYGAVVPPRDAGFPQPIYGAMPPGKSGGN